jgi:hypothetical protein
MILFMRNQALVSDSDSPITILAATRLPILARDGQHPHVATLHRWITRGVRGVVLESFLVGGARCTTSAMVETFLARLNSPADAPAPRTPTRRNREQAKADKDLMKAGW